MDAVVAIAATERPPAADRRRIILHFFEDELGFENKSKGLRIIIPITKPAITVIMAFSKFASNFPKIHTAASQPKLAIPILFKNENLRVDCI